MVDVYSRPNVFDKKSDPTQNIFTTSLSGKCRLPRCRSLSSWKLRVSLFLGPSVNSPGLPKKDEIYENVLDVFERIHFF